MKEHERPGRLLPAALDALAGRMEKALREDILPFWLPYRDPAGGFYGEIRADGSCDPAAPKGLVMHARFLWAYSAASRALGDRRWREAADHAYRYLTGPLRDPAGGGYWWIVDAAGRPAISDKLVYGEAFAVYALAEYYMATGLPEALDSALALFDLVEGVARDRGAGGYFEGVDEAWRGPKRIALSEVDIPCDKSMNTNLHVLEAWSNLYRASSEPRVRDSLAELLEVFADRVFAPPPAQPAASPGAAPAPGAPPPARLDLYFDAAWNRLGEPGAVSYGHDVEASWLMTEAARLAHGSLAAAPAAVRDRVAGAQAASLATLKANGGSMPAELRGGRLDTDRVWWVQAETIVGMVDAWERSGDPAYLEAAAGVWDYVEARVVDRERGEWHWAVREPGPAAAAPTGPDPDRPKGGLWKTCYHNGRACLEVAARRRAAATEGIYEARRAAVEDAWTELVAAGNAPVLPGNGIFERYERPILTAAHVPPRWRYDYDRERNPYFMERLGVNAVFNAGAIKRGGRYFLVCRVEGADRKSFFALAESPDGVRGFRFTGGPILLGDPPSGPSGRPEPETNVYDMRLTAHEDGWIYGIFCAERKDPAAPAGDTSMATAAAGIVRTRDLASWERLPDLASDSPQQRNVVLHPEFVGGKYLLYTRPQDGFIETGSGGGICTALCDTMEGAAARDERVLDPKLYHTIKEVKNGSGAPPIKTQAGWLHVAHGVRNTAAGLRYVIYAFLCDPADPRRLIAAPGGYLIAPEAGERVGDVSNVVFANGAIAAADGRLLLYYASSDTRLHVAETSVDRLVDYVRRTPPDGLRSRASVESRLALIRGNARVE